MPDAPATTPPSEPIPFKAELIRKGIHLLALVVPLGMAVLGKAWSVYLLVPAALLAIGADVLRTRSAWFARYIQRIFGFMMRQEEQPPVGGPISINGATWVLVSAALLAVIFPVRLAVPSFVSFMICDAAAALVGRRFGRHRWPASPRTLEGSLAFLLVGLGIMAFFPDLVYWTAALSMVVATLMEALPGPFNDNLRVPIATTTMLFLLERFALGREVSLFFGP